jgi:hypothetical protein
VAARFGIAGAKLRQINGLGPRARLAADRTLLVPANQDALLVSEPILDDLPSPEADYEVAADRKMGRSVLKVSAGKVKVATKRGARPGVTKAGAKPTASKIAGSKRPAPGKAALLASQGPRKVASRRVRTRG